MTEAPGAGQPLGGEGWVDLFHQRRVWRLQPEDLDRWREANDTFFEFITDHVPSGERILELGCGPGRHALTLARLGYRVVGVEIDRRVARQALANSALLGTDQQLTLVRADARRPSRLFRAGRFAAITHGGLMEHFPSVAEIRAAIHDQLRVAPRLIFDVPVASARNEALFARDSVFRNVWTSEFWRHEVLSGFRIEAARLDPHDHRSMTDDWVCVVAAGPS